MKEKLNIVLLTKEMLLGLVKEAQNDKNFKLEDVEIKYQDINNLDNVDSIVEYLQDGYQSMLGHITIGYNIHSGELLVKNIESEKFGNGKFLEYRIGYRNNGRIQFGGNNIDKDTIKGYLCKNNYIYSFMEKQKELALKMGNQILDKKIMTKVELKEHINGSGTFKKQLSNGEGIKYLKNILSALKFILDNELIYTKMVFNIEKKDIEFIKICEVSDEDYFLALANLEVKFSYDKNFILI